MKRPLLEVLICAAAVSTGPSCASLVNQKDVCGWIDLDATPGIEATAPRRLTGVASAECGSTGEYALRRPDYSLKFWNGNGPGAVLFVGATAVDGRRLSVVSDALEEIDFAANRYLGDQVRAFSHKLRTVPADPAPVVVAISIHDEGGRVLGTESITVQLKAGHYVFRDM